MRVAILHEPLSQARDVITNGILARKEFWYRTQHCMFMQISRDIDIGALWLLGLLRTGS